MNFHIFVLYQFNPLPANDLIELKNMTVMQFEIFSFELLHSITKSSTKELPKMKI